MFTAEVSDDGRDGIAGAPDAADVAVSVEDGFETEVPDDVAVEGIASSSRQFSSCEKQSHHVATTETNIPGPAAPAAALSHGFGGDTDDILSNGVSHAAPAICAPLIFLFRRGRIRQSRHDRGEETVAPRCAGAALLATKATSSR